MFDNIPDWIELLFGLLTTQIPILWVFWRSRRKTKQRDLYVRVGNFFEWKSRRKDADQS